MQTRKGVTEMIYASGCCIGNRGREPMHYVYRSQLSSFYTSPEAVRVRTSHEARAVSPLESPSRPLAFCAL